MNFINTNKYYVKSKNEATCYSYGLRRGNFNMDNYTMQKICLHPQLQKEYALVECKSKYYKLMFDFDFKDTDEIVKPFMDKSEEIITHIIKNINIILNKIFVLTTEEVKYIYACKNNGKGIHLYYPNIIIDKFIHIYIRNQLMELLKKEDKYPQNILDKIIDLSVCKSISIRLFYCQKNGGYYYPVKDKSTFEFSEIPEEHFKYCQINTNNTEINVKLKIDEELIYNYNFGIIKKKNDSIILEEKIENITDIVILDIGEKKQMVFELANILDIKRIDDFENWKGLVYLFKNYGLNEEIIEISKKSHKFDNSSIKIINNILKKNTSIEKIIKLGSLIKWASEDNFLETIKILEKYDIQLNLNIKNTDEILLCNHYNKYDYIENEKYISDKFINKAIENINNGIKIIIMQAGTGVGKTTAIEKIIKNLGINESIISIISRRSMIATHQNAFSFKMSSYLDNEKDYDKFIASLEYLSIIKKDNYKIVILDEVNSLINHYYSDTMNGKRLNSLNKLIKMIHKADLVLCCDANITEVVFKLFENINLEYFYYRNKYQNKKNVIMNIYSTDNSSEDISIYNFCKIIKPSIENKESVLIFSDSKSVSIKINAILKEYNNEQNYFMIFNKDSGDITDLNNCNETFKNKCVISSPKICYGLDILIKYDNIYCIYKNTNKLNSMTALEYHQQYSRARNCKCVNILVTNKYQDKYKNKYMSFEKNKKLEETSYLKYKNEQESLIKKYNTVDELCAISTINGINISKESIFTDIHFYKTWYNNLFNKNKMQIVELLAKEAGYTINNIKLKLEEYNKISFNKAIREFNKKVIKIGEKIYDNIDIDESEEKIAINIAEQIECRMKIIDMNEILELDDNEIKKILTNEKHFNSYLNKRYLNKSKDEFENLILNMSNNDIPQIAKDNKLINKIKVIFSLEELLRIKRYHINDINITDIDSIKKSLNGKINDIYLLYEGDRSKKSIIDRLQKSIAKIENNNRLQKFIADCYNTFGDIIKINKKRKNKKINNTETKINIYNFIGPTFQNLSN